MSELTERLVDINVLVEGLKGEGDILQHYINSAEIIDYIIKESNHKLSIKWENASWQIFVHWNAGTVVLGPGNLRTVAEEAINFYIAQG